MSASSNSPAALLTARQLAPRLGITPTALRVRICRGGIARDELPPPIEIGARRYWPTPAVEAWIERKAQEALTAARPRHTGAGRRGRPRLPRASDRPSPAGTDNK